MGHLQVSSVSSSSFFGFSCSKLLSNNKALNLAFLPSFWTLTSGLILFSVFSPFTLCLGLFDIDFNQVLGKFIDIGKSIGNVLNGIAQGSIAAIKAAFPGGESPMEAFKRVYGEVTSGQEPRMPEDENIEQGDTIQNGDETNITNNTTNNTIEAHIIVNDIRVFLNIFSPSI